MKRRPLTAYKFLFKSLVFLLPTQLAYHSWPTWAHVFGIRVDYLSPAVYLTDIILFILAFLFFLKPGNIEKFRVNLFKHRFLVIIFLVFVLINVFNAASFYPAVMKWAKVGELALFAYILKTDKNINVENWIIWPLTFSIAFFSLIGLAQFFLGSTVGGPLYFLGERSFNLATPGISRFSFLGEEHLRSYSTFSHPNSFAGFLGVSLFLIFFSRSGKEMFSKIIRKAGVILGGVAFFLTASLGAYIAGAIGFLYWQIGRRNKKLLTKTSYVLLFAAVAVSILFPFFYSIVPGFFRFPEENLLNRALLTQAAETMIAKSPVWGVGLNSFVVILPLMGNTFGPIWFLQPVHNIFLLVFSEGGAVGLLLVLFTLYFCFKSLASNKNWQLSVPFVFIIVTGLADHYWFTLQQNELLLSLLFGLSFRNTKWTKI